jgi:hypothetical protein
MSRNLFAREGTTSDIVSTSQNTAGVFSEILEIDPTDGTLIQIENRVATGSAMGVPFFAEFKDGNDNHLPGDSAFRFRLERAGNRQDLIVSEEITNIQPFKSLALTDQQDAEKIDAVKIELEAPGSGMSVQSVTVRDVDSLYVDLKSTAVVDHGNSSFLFDKQAITERGR